MHQLGSVDTGLSLDFDQTSAPIVQVIPDERRVGYW